MPWLPSVRTDVDLRGLSLTPRQGYLLSRLDGRSDLRALAAVMGEPAEAIERMLHELVDLGAVSPSTAAGPSAPGGVASVAAGHSTVPPNTNDEPATAPETVAPAGTEAPADPAELDAADEPDPEPGTHRERYMSLFARRPADERTHAARTAHEPDLSALCFDPLGSVVSALLENPRTGLTQARLIARHHHTAAGLDAVASRAAFAADPGVRRALAGNPQLPAGLFRRLWQPRRLLELHGLGASREIPEGTRRAARELLRQRFATGQAEEKVELILKTEGRCLAMLAGLGLDGKATALLCGRPISSTLLVQNLAHWSATPPALVAHLLRQEVVRRSPQLRQQVARHPNARES